MGAALSTLLLLSAAAAGQEGERHAALRRAVSLYASFDEAARADFGGGILTLSTRFDQPVEKGKPAEKGKYTFKEGFDLKVFRIAKSKGVHKGALEVLDVLPNNGRLFFPAKGNLAYKKGGWGGAVSFWINTDPDTLLKTPFCDPVQITQKGAINGGLWVDFDKSKPRSLRLGAFPAVPEGQKLIPESDPEAPLVRVPKVGFKQGDWHHIVMSWTNLDTGKPDARVSLYIDNKHIGDVKDRPLAMDWDVDKAGIYIAVNYVGLLDELAIFRRPLEAGEVGVLHDQPGVLAGLGGKK
jgi:hypothetical protein